MRVCIESGLVELNKHIREATVRRNVVVQLIRMFRDSGHPDYNNIDMQDVEARASFLAHTDDPSIPLGLTELLDEQHDNNADDETVDKAATPAERLRNVEDLDKHMQRSRPQLFFPQRDSDAGKEVEASAVSAFGKFSAFSLTTGSKWEDQFCGSYIPRVFNLTIPWYVGGPDLKDKARFRRSSSDTPPLTLTDFTKMIPQRVESQLRWDWDLVPAIWSLWFASAVNMSKSLSMMRAMTRAAEVEEPNEKAIGAVAAKIHEFLHSGVYMRSDGVKFPIRGDITKLPLAIGLTSQQRNLLNNYYSISGRISGTRQVRRTINHM